MQPNNRKMWIIFGVIVALTIIGIVIWKLIMVHP